VVAASGGNHGLAVAYASTRLGVAATIYLPETASADRVARIKAWGTTVIQYGSNPNDALQRAQEHGEAEGMVYIHPFDAERTVEGTATLGVELLEDVPDADCILIAIGGGGLIAGMAAAIKQLRPNITIIGVEPVGAPSMHAALRAGKVVDLAEITTIADTLAPRHVCELTRSLTAKYVDDVVLVDDQAIMRAARWLWRECNQLVEPAGAASIAAFQSGAVDLSRYQHPVALICGGNAAADGVFERYEAAIR
jgi:threonine dehydratase